METMEEQVNLLVKKVWDRYQSSPPDQRLMIAIAGIPGSGKTTLARAIVKQLNSLSPSAPIAIHLPMDGYHLPLATLYAHPDSAHMLARRGAPFTFDLSRLQTTLHELRQAVSSTGTILVPSFSHAAKDPVEGALVVQAHTRIVFWDGNYLAFDRDGWRDIAACFDERWFVDIDEHLAARRLVARHLRAGIAASEDEAWLRVEGNDLLNARDIVDHRALVHEVLYSREDEVWRAEFDENK